MTFDFEERQGDLIQSIAPTDSIVIGVSEDLKLSSKGITGMIRQKYGNQLSQVPKRTVGQVTAITQGQRHIFFLITRQKSYNKPSYSDIESCLVELRKSCEKNRVLSLAIPRELGDGLEGLQEKHIKQVLFTVFSGWSGKMVMYHPVVE